MDEIRVTCSGADTLPLDAIEDFQKGLKKRSKQDVELIIKSIERFGFSFPFFVWKGEGHNWCLDGHGRIAALAEMRRRGCNLPLFPVCYIEAVDEEEAKQKLLRLNSQYGDMTRETVLQFAEDIKVEWDELKLPMGVLRMVDQDQAVEGPTPQINNSEELKERWGTALGQVWKLGSHRLSCGDSTVGNDVALLLSGEVPKLMVTDPPYGVKYDANWRNVAAEKGLIGPAARRVTAVENDDRIDWSDAYKLFPGAVFYCWHADQYTSAIQQSIEGAGFQIRAQIIWKKQAFVISRGHYHGGHEPCWYAVRDGATAGWIGDRSQSTVWEIKWDRNVEGGHSTQKPVECMARPIRNHEGDVYDPFLGSGTTIIAAEQFGRKCYGMEISPAYVAVALQRWADFTGGKPELINEQPKPA